MRLCGDGNCLKPCNGDGGQDRLAASNSNSSSSRAGCSEQEGKQQSKSERARELLSQTLEGARACYALRLLLLC